MSKFAFTLFVMCALVLVDWCVVSLGMAWINQGHGLHPLFAFPVATVYTICSAGAVVWFCKG